MPMGMAEIAVALKTRICAMIRRVHSRRRSFQDLRLTVECVAAAIRAVVANEATSNVKE
jgi:hypothetical protein